MKKWNNWKRITSGDNVLDEYITAISDGDEKKGIGIPAGYAILVEKEAGTKAGLFSLFFVKENLEEKINAAYLTTDKDPCWIIDRLEEYFNHNISKRLGRGCEFAIIDGFWGGHLRAETKVNEKTFPINDLRNIAEVHDVLREVMLSWNHYEEMLQHPAEFENCKGVWVYDTVTTLIHYGGEEALSFIAHQMAAQKKHSYTSLFIIERDSLPQEHVAKLRIWADGFIKFWKEDTASQSKRFLQIVEMRWWDHYDGKIEYDICDDGLNIKETEDMKKWLKKRQAKKGRRRRRRR